MKIKCYKWANLDVYYQVLHRNVDGSLEILILREKHADGRDFKGVRFIQNDAKWFFKNAKEVELDYFELFK